MVSGMAQVAPATAEGGILTVPNAITLCRLLCIPVFVVLLARPDDSGWYAAGWLLAVLGITDGVDGYVARHFNHVSTAGKVLDPLADRLLLATAAIATVVVGAVPLWVGVIALTREVVVAAGFLYVAWAGGRRMEVSLAGKAGTFALMVALPLFLAAGADDGWHQVAQVLAWGFVIPGLALGWYAAATYVPAARSLLAESKRTRDQEAPA
jgi:cardiolipin synthase (CMP-forming)